MASFMAQSHGLERIHQEGLADRLDVVIENLEDGLLGGGDFGLILEGLPKVDTGQPLIFGVGADVPLERKVDPVMDRPDLKPALEIADTPVLLGALEDLDEILRLAALERLAQLAERHSSALGMVFKEAPGGAEFKLPVVKLPRDRGRHRSRPGNQSGQPLPLFFAQPDEVPADCQVRFVHPEALGAAACSRGMAPAIMGRA
jgi:hypothetical protein